MLRSRLLCQGPHSAILFALLVTIHHVQGVRSLCLSDSLSSLKMLTYNILNKLRLRFFIFFFIFKYKPPTLTNHSTNPPHGLALQPWRIERKQEERDAGLCRDDGRAWSTVQGFCNFNVRDVDILIRGFVIIIYLKKSALKALPALEVAQSTWPLMHADVLNSG